MADTPTTENTAPPPAQTPDARTDLMSRLGEGFALKAAGKLTTEDPTPEGFEDTTRNGAAPEGEPPPPETTAPPAPPPKVAPRPTRTGPPQTPEEKRNAIASQWKEVNADRDKLRARVQELEGQLTGLGQLKTNAEAAKSWEAKAQEYDKILREVAAERHPELIGPIQQRQQQAVTTAKAAVPKDQAETIANLLQQPDSQQRDEAIEGIMENLSSVKRARLARAIAEYEDAQSQRANLSQRSQEAFQARQKQIQDQHQKGLQIFDQEVAEWTNPEHGLEMLVEKAGDTAHNQRRAAILNNARALFSGEVSNVQDIARAALWSAFGESLSRQNLAQAKEIQRLTAEITALKGGGPGLENAGVTESNTEAPETKPANMSTAEWIIKQAQREGVAFGSGRY